MSETLLDQLQKENDELARQAYYDELTGVMNRRAVEMKITELMKDGGMLLVGDLDRFKSINDRFGHLEGDRCLKKAAQLLQNLIRSYDVLGRIGGDEFVIYMPNCNEEYLTTRISENIERRFHSYSDDVKNGIRLSITLAGAICQPGETYDQLFDRADQRLIAKKEQKRSGAPKQSGENWLKDLDQIHNDLMEEIHMPGAYCQDYESFKSIYRFLERGMSRVEKKVCVVLFTIVDTDGQTMSPLNLDEDMNMLGNVLQGSLRLGDVYTRYSSCQYLTLLLDVDEGLAEMVAERIKSKYLDQTTESHLLVHYCYALQSARILD